MGVGSLVLAAGDNVTVTGGRWRLGTCQGGPPGSTRTRGGGPGTDKPTVSSRGQVKSGTGPNRDMLALVIGFTTCTDRQWSACNDPCRNTCHFPEYNSSEEKIWLMMKL